MEGEPLVPKNVTRRDRRRGISPTISVVIASTDTEDVLNSCICSLHARFDPAHTEYVVARAGSVHTVGDLKRQFPYVHFINASASSSPIDLRMHGIRAATGDIVLIVQHGQAGQSDLATDMEPNLRDEQPEQIASPSWERLALRVNRQSASVASNG